MTLVGGAYVFSGPIPFIDRVTAQSSEELLRAYAAKDTDGDLLPDWQEVLYGTDPEDPRSFKEDMTDAEAVSAGLLTPKAPSVPEDNSDIDIEGVLAPEGTFTDALAQEFFTTYFTNRGTNPPTAAELDTFAEQFVRNFQANNDEFSSYALSSVRVSGSGAAALTSYVVAVEETINANDPHLPKSELEYLDDAVTRNDSTALDSLAQIGAAYSATSEELLRTPVPAEAKVAHLAIANAMKHMGTAVTYMSSMETDPVRVMLGVEAYAGAAAEYRAAFTAMHVVLATSGVTIANGAAGYDFYTTAEQARLAQ